MHFCNYGVMYTLSGTAYILQILVIYDRTTEVLVGNCEDNYSK